MNKLRLFKGLLVLLCFISTAAYGQKETKVFKEVFNVTPETVIDINTSNADIEFETWDKNQIEIVATIEIEGATAAEAKKYFENGTIEIVGNSRKISLRTGSENIWFLGHGESGFDKLHFDNGLKLEMDELMLNLDELTSDSLFVAFDILEHMPPIPPTNFDYNAFEKEGEKYLKEWQSEFKEGFGKEYQEKMKAWQKELEKKNQAASKEREKMLKKRAEQREKKLEERAAERAERMEKRAEQREERMIALQERREANKERLKNRFPSGTYRTDSNRSFFKSNNSQQQNQPNIFYLSSDGEHKNYKVKKSIKIKMPKGNKIKMNVRHGEVKLAANTVNIDAKLSYVNLLAFVIDGEETNVRASYSPVFVEKWKLGQLQTEYSDAVNLQEVVDLRLTATSSEVTIDRLIKKALIKNDFGPLKILSVAKSFSDLDVSLQNAELDCEMPDTAFSIYVNGTSSKLTLPARIAIERTKNGNTVIHKGYYKNKNSDKGIVINSKYSEVLID